MNIKRIIREEMEDFDWVKNENNPWEDIPQEQIEQLTEREVRLINSIFEEEVYWSKIYDCEPRFEITNLSFEEDEEWSSGVFRGIRRTIDICFNTICDNQTYNNITYLCATIDRDTLDYNVA
jgi:hypothetical protein